MLLLQGNYVELTVTSKNEYLRENIFEQKMRIRVTITTTIMMRQINMFVMMTYPLWIGSTSMSTC